MYKFDPSIGTIYFIPDNNFAFKKVENATAIVIPSGQQMLLKGDITIDGDLVVDGELWLL